MSRRRIFSVLTLVIGLILVFVLWEELQDFGAEIYRFFN